MILLQIRKFRKFALDYKLPLYLTIILSCFVMRIEMKGGKELGQNSSNTKVGYGVKDLQKQKVTVIGAVSIIYAMVASGVWGVEALIPLAGPGLAIVILCVLPIIWALPLSLFSAELGSAIPTEGGPYSWVHRALGECWGFQHCYWRLLTAYTGTPAFIVLAGDYVATWMNWNEITAYIFKMILVIIIAIVAWKGMRDVAWLSTVLSVVIAVAMIVLMVIGFSHWQFNPVEPFTPPGQSWVQSLGLGLAVGLWLYAGYDSLGLVAGELENPQVIPKALMIGMPLVVLTYIPTTIVSLAAVGQWESWGSDGVSYVDVIALASPMLAGIFTFVAFLGQISYYNSYSSTNVRWLFVLADDNLAPKGLTRLNKHGVPAWPIIIGVIDCAIFCAFDFVSVLKVNVTTFLFAYALLAIIACIIRVKEPDLERPFNIKISTPLYIAMAVLIVLIAFVALLVNGTDYFIWGASFVSVGPFLYWALKKRYGGRNDQPKDKISCMNRKDFLSFSSVYAIIAFICAVGYFFLPWYDEPSWYGNFDLLIKLIGILAIVAAVLAVVFYFVYKKSEAAFKAEEMAQ